MPKIIFDNVSKAFVNNSGQQIQVIDKLFLEIEPEKITCILGPSGCGKTTLINLLAGYIFPDDGYIFYDSQYINGPGPERAVVFQDQALFLWKTVKENIGFGLKCQKINEALREKIINERLDKFGLHGFGDSYPCQLSGGMKQRVGLAGALATRPKVLLMDEPFSSLDEQTREMLQEDLLKIYYEARPTIILVTHNIEEATFLADTIVILTKRPGTIKSIIKVALPNPRISEVRNSTEFFQLRRHIWETIREEIK
ncbi:MAG: ABC transporter ATP-binding protein [Patescibacteria group bacterium]